MIAAIVLSICLILLGLMGDFLVDWLWFSTIGYLGVFCEVLQEVPEELKARTDTRGEASLRGHLKSEGDEQTGSQSYIPPDPKDDKALHTALDLIRGIQKNSAYPPNPKTAVPSALPGRQ